MLQLKLFESSSNFLRVAQTFFDFEAKGQGQFSQTKRAADTPDNNAYTRQKQKQTDKIITLSEKIKIAN